MLLLYPPSKKKKTKFRSVCWSICLFFLLSPFLVSPTSLDPLKFHKTTMHHTYMCTEEYNYIHKNPKGENPTICLLLKDSRGRSFNLRVLYLTLLLYLKQGYFCKVDLCILRSYNENPLSMNDMIHILPLLVEAL